MEKRRIEVTINGQIHAFVAGVGEEEYIRGLADYLNEKIAEVAGSNYGKMLSNDKKYIVTAMNILDDYYKILTKYEELSKSSGKVNEARVSEAESKAEYKAESKAKSRHDSRIEAQLRAEIDEYINEIKTLQKENARLKDKQKNLEYELQYVQNLYEEQKREYERDESD